MPGAVSHYRLARRNRGNAKKKRKKNRNRGNAKKKRKKKYRRRPIAPRARVSISIDAIAGHFPQQKQCGQQFAAGRGGGAFLQQKQCGQRRAAGRGAGPSTQPNT